MSDFSPVQLRVAVVGLGSVGRAVMAAIAKEPRLVLVGGCDISADKLDRARSEFGESLTWTDNPESFESVNIAAVCTGPHFDRVVPTVRQLMRLKAHVVSDCAEMAWPWLKHPHLADVIASEARAAGVVLLGTGAHPGIASATLPLTLAAMTSGHREVKVSVLLNTKTMRSTLRRRIGLGLAAKKFRTLANEGRVGLPGAGEAVTLIAQGLGHHPMRSEIKLNILAGFADGADQSVGIKQTASWNGDQTHVDVELCCNEAEHPSCIVRIVDDIGTREGSFQLNDLEASTAAAMISAMLSVSKLQAGIRTVLDLPVARV